MSERSPFLGIKVITAREKERGMEPELKERLRTARKSFLRMGQKHCKVKFVKRQRAIKVLRLLMLKPIEVLGDYIKGALVSRYSTIKVLVKGVDVGFYFCWVFSDGARGESNFRDRFGN